MLLSVTEKEERETKAEETEHREDCRVNDPLATNNDTHAAPEPKRQAEDSSLNPRPGHGRDARELREPINLRVETPREPHPVGAMSIDTVREPVTRSESMRPHHGHEHKSHHRQRQNHVSTVMLHGVPIVSLHIDGKERLCLAQISTTLLKDFSYNEIHNRRVALGVTCVQCTPVQLEILRRAGAMPVSSRRCGMITKREAERLVKSFLDDTAPPKLPDNFFFDVTHACGWGCRGQFMPSRYNSSRAKCIKCCYCNMFFSPNKFIFHFHRTADAVYNHPDAANFNSWRRHLKLTEAEPDDDLLHAWEDVKAMFNGGTRKRVMSLATSSTTTKVSVSSSEITTPVKKMRSEAPQPQPVRTPGPNYSYPVFPVPNKVMTVKSVPPHPAFSMPFQFEGNLGKSMDLPPAPTPMAENSGKVWTSPDSYYPPYEMIWAKHLGLTAPESSFVPQAYNRSEKDDEQYDMEENHDDEYGRLARPRLSAFTPVTNRSLSVVTSMSSSSHSEHGDMSSQCSISPSHASIALQPEDTDSEDVDVDTIDDDASSSLRCEVQNYNFDDDKQDTVQQHHETELIHETTSNSSTHCEENNNVSVKAELTRHTIDSIMESKASEKVTSDPADEEEETDAANNEDADAGSELSTSPAPKGTDHDSSTPVLLVSHTTSPLISIKRSLRSLKV